MARSSSSTTPSRPVQQRNLETRAGTPRCSTAPASFSRSSDGARERAKAACKSSSRISRIRRAAWSRAWTHLERQRGGRGFLGGPVEAQIELDRRMLEERIIAIRAELEGVVRTRELHRKDRRKVPYPIVAIVGYTNAGKSTLFNRICRS